MERSKSSLRLGVVIPLANEQETISNLLQDILGYLGEKDRIFCILDNVSKDQTRGLVEQEALHDKRVCLVWAPENRCVVDAYFCGYRRALAANCKWILEMDGGYSHRPDEIPRFIAAMTEGVEYAAGSRFVAEGNYNGRWSRNLLSRAGTVLANVMLGTRMQDMTSGFECFSRRAMEYVVAKGVSSKAHFFQTEIRFMLRNWKWKEIPISYSSPSNSVGGQAIGESFRLLWMLTKQARLKKMT